MNRPGQTNFIVAVSTIALLLTSPATAAGTERVRASNVVKLRTLVGEKVTVFGRVESTGKSSSGHHFLNFRGKQFSVMCPSGAVTRFPRGGPATIYRGQTVEVTGVLDLYKGKLQLKISDPRQVQQLASSPGQSVTAVELRFLGSDTWVSPAGLRYEGRDPDGRTRVEHVLRHARDLPNRAGPHGVFDGDRGVVFAIIDEAWRRAEQQKLRPRVERNRSSYLVPMGRRVGYLGGRTGKQRGQPPLDRVFIVFETQTKRIITAFPR